MASRLGTRAVWCAVLVATTLSVGGCAINPLVVWTPPVEEKLPDSPLDSMEGARAYAATYKAALRSKAQEYAQHQGQLNDALLGLGLLTLGTLVSTAHKDVPLTLGFLFGGTYLYGQQNLGKPRLEVYQTGISATNCAVAAVAPLNFSAYELRAIRTASDTLSRAELPALGEALARARQVYAETGVSDESRRKAIDDQLKAAADTYQAGLTLLHDSSQLPGRVAAAAAGLKGSVDVVAAQVDRLASNTIVDPATVSRSLGGLVAIVGSIAPGAGLDTAFSGRLAARGTQGASAALPSPGNRSARQQPPPAQNTQGLVTALADLGKAQAAVDAKVKYLGGRIAASKEFGSGALAALAQCEVKVSDALLALKVEPAAVSLAKPASDPVASEIYVSGGAKNYTGRLTQTAAGVELMTPRAGEGTFVIKVTKEAKAGDINLRIEDSSNPAQAKMVKITIEASK